MANLGQDIINVGRIPRDDGAKRAVQSFMDAFMGVKRLTLEKEKIQIIKDVESDRLKQQERIEQSRIKATKAHRERMFSIQESLGESQERIEILNQSKFNAQKDFNILKLEKGNLAIEKQIEILKSQNTLNELLSRESLKRTQIKSQEQQFIKDALELSDKTADEDFELYKANKILVEGQRNTFKRLRKEAILGIKGASDRLGLMLGQSTKAELDIPRVLKSRKEIKVEQRLEQLKLEEKAELELEAEALKKNKKKKERDFNIIDILKESLLRHPNKETGIISKLKPSINQPSTKEDIIKQLLGQTSKNRINIP